MTTAITVQPAGHDVKVTIAGEPEIELEANSGSKTFYIHSGQPTITISEVAQDDSPND